MTEAIKPKQKRKGCLGCLWIFLLVVAAVFIAPPTCELLREKWEISSAISNAKTIRLEHFRNSFEAGTNDGKDQLIATKEMKPDEFYFVGRAFPPFFDAWMPGLEKKCVFDPHHRIIITDASGNVTRIEICFTCGQMAILHGDEKYGHVVDTPFLWAESLSQFFAHEGMPYSPDIYRRPYLENEGTNAPPTAAPQ